MGIRESIDKIKQGIGVVPQSIDPEAKRQAIESKHYGLLAEQHIENQNIENEQMEAENAALESEVKREEFEHSPAGKTLRAAEETGKKVGAGVGGAISKVAAGAAGIFKATGEGLRKRAAEKRAQQEAQGQGAQEEGGYPQEYERGYESAQPMMQGQPRRANPVTGGGGGWMGMEMQRYHPHMEETEGRPTNVPVMLQNEFSRRGTAMGAEGARRIPPILQNELMRGTRGRGQPSAMGGQRRMNPLLAQELMRNAAKRTRQPARGGRVPRQTYINPLLAQEFARQAMKRGRMRTGRRRGRK